MVNPKKIVVIGAGWYGVHTALTLRKYYSEFEITILERKPDIFMGVSGMFGIRLHAGPHYPRSEATREDCHKGLLRFTSEYPELVRDNHVSFYLLGKEDAEGYISKVDKATFDSVCREFAFRKEINTAEFGFTNVEYGADLAEPTAIIGPPLRRYFRKRLAQADINIHCCSSVADIQRLSDEQFKVVVADERTTYVGDFLVNTTNCQSFSPKQLPFATELVHQPCLGLLYRYLGKNNPPLFIIMDGAYPCLMPYADEIGHSKKYVVVHGKWTILGSFPSSEEAQSTLEQIDNTFVDRHVRNNCEADIGKFYPRFFEYFQYIGWKGAVLAKPKAGTEFRSAMTFMKEGVIYVTPGKITNIFDVAEEIALFLSPHQGDIIENNGFSYVKGGILHKAETELRNGKLDHRSTAQLQPYAGML